MCSSPEIIKRVAESLVAARDNRSGDVEAALANLRKVDTTYDKPAPLYRTIDDFERICAPSKLSYGDGYRLSMAAKKKNNGNPKFIDEMQFGNCHDGQTKLILALLEFVQGAVKKFKNAAMHLVYVGASTPAADAVRIAFPSVRQTIFDPADNMMRLMPPGYRKVARVTHRIGYHPDDRIVAVRDFFGDETALNIRSTRGIDKAGELLLFASDVRNDNDDESIVEDMLNQQRWARLLKCDRFVMKFRIPFDESREKSIARYGPPRGFKPDGRTMHYLVGDIYIQAYPPVGSVELRIVGNGRRRKGYDVSRIEDLMFAHNHFWRPHALFGASYLQYDHAVEKYILENLPGSTRARVELAIAANRKRSGKKTMRDCVRKNKGRPGEVGAILARC